MKTLFKTLAISFLCFAAISCEKNAVSPEEKTENESIDISSTPAEALSVKPTATQWGKHWNHGGIHCGGVGIYCIRRLVALDGAEKGIEKDETFGVPVVEINNNNIRIVTVGLGGNPSDETLQLFKTKKIEVPSSGLPPEIVEDLLSKLKARSIDKVVFEPVNQKYNVVESTFNGKKVTIIAGFQKTKLTIDGKVFNLLVITTSGKADEKLRIPNF